MPNGLFISYSRRDKAQGRITELGERIKQDFAWLPHWKPRNTGIREQKTSWE